MNPPGARTPRLRRLAAVFGVMLGAAVVVQSGSRILQAQPSGDSDAEAKPAPPKPDEGIKPAKFDHAQHAKLHETHKEITAPVVTEETCSNCHGADAKGNLDQPAKQGHKPCMDSGCHIRDFLSVGPTYRGSSDPEKQKRYRQAAAMCLGCHSTKDNQAPANYTKAKPDNTFKNNASPNYRMDMTHYDHTQKGKGCRTCHVVNRRTYALELDSPGHAECSTCHNEEGDASPMTACAECHKLAPSVEAPTWKERKRSDVRSCGSEGHEELAKSRKTSTGKVACFKHERTEHRFRGDKPIQCNECHFMIGNKKLWSNGRSYATVPDIQKNPIINNDRDLAHKSCGGDSVCHRRDVDDSRGTSRCKLCHSQKLIDSGLF